MRVSRLKTKQVDPSHKNGGRKSCWDVPLIVRNVDDEKRVLSQNVDFNKIL